MPDWCVCKPVWEYLVKCLSTCVRITGEVPVYPCENTWWSACLPVWEYLVECMPAHVIMSDDVPVYQPKKGRWCACLSMWEYMAMCLSTQVSSIPWWCAWSSVWECQVICPPSRITIKLIAKVRTLINVDFDIFAWLLLGWEGLKSSRP
jgi:hypothetical protein